MAEPIKTIDLFQEVLASDKLINFQGWNTRIISSFGDNPGILWDRLQWDPWMAMAIFEDMECKDATMFSALEKRRNGVLDLPRYVTPASDSRQDKKVAAFVEETLSDYWGGTNTTFGEDTCATSFEGFLGEALEAVGDGVTIGEKIFDDASDRVYIKEVKFKPQHLFSFGDTALAAYSTSLMMYPQSGPLRLRSGVTIDSMAMGEELPESKFFVFSNRIRKGNRWGTPIKKYVFWPAWMKRNGVKAWLKYIEKGAGTVVSRYNDGAGEAEQQNAIGAAIAVVEQSAVGIPKKFLLEVLNEVRNIGTSHKELIDDYCNAEISRAIVGQTLTGRGNDGGHGSNALGEVHERVEGKIITADAKRLMANINKQIIPAIVIPNFGPNTKCPLWGVEYEPKEDTASKAKLFASAHKDIGIDLSIDQIREDLQLDEPVGDNDRLAAAAVAQTPALQPEDPNRMPDAEFAEGDDLKKKSLPPSGTRLSSRMERFKRQRPSMIEFSEE
jgi:phage gp29-like protein